MLRDFRGILHHTAVKLEREAGRMNLSQRDDEIAKAGPKVDKPAGG